MLEAEPKSLQLPGSTTPYSMPSSTTKSMSTAAPPRLTCRWPFAARAGVLVRSPVKFLMGNPGIVPVTVISTYPLLSCLVASADSRSNAAASGTGADDWGGDDWDVGDVLCPPMAGIPTAAETRTTAGGEPGRPRLQPGVLAQNVQRLMRVIGQNVIVAPVAPQCCHLYQDRSSGPPHDARF